MPIIQTREAHALEWQDMLSLVARLKDDSRHRDAFLILIGSHFGLRFSDLASLRWRDILLKDSFEILEQKTSNTRKTKKSRKITISSELKVAIFEFSEKLMLSEDDFILLSKKSTQLSLQYVNRHLKKLKLAYEIRVKNISSHTLRKTFGRRVWSNNGRSEASLIKLSEIFGHSSVAVTRRYLGITDEEIADVYLNL